MCSDYLNAYQTSVGYSDKITYTKISKVSYLLKLKAQCNSITDLDRKHKAWAKKNYLQTKSSIKMEEYL